MENVLEHRDKAGVPDAILLENYTDENEFIENLRKRYNDNCIYTYIGQTLVSVNPYKDVGIYSDAYQEKYRKAIVYEVPPHTYAVSENAYRSMTAENQDNCILISGESGSGKTETSKHILEFIASSSRHRKAGDRIRDKLLKSNPVLEAFGNAKTNRNINSSRFGKYMDIECDFKGDPIGGHITNYLLEKSRVVHQEAGEENFHIFYQFLKGAESKHLSEFHISRNIHDYFYLRQGFKDIKDSVREVTSFKEITTALEVIGFDDTEKHAMWSTIATILHLGNLSFKENEVGDAIIVSEQTIKYISELLMCDFETLSNALTNRSIEARGETVVSPLSLDQALYARDALAKSIYERLFEWLISRLNESMRPKQKITTTNLIGILDIYGFEVFNRNGFEQFCINYCNEKLQQVFIELTLRIEQEEYRREGIQWQEIKYFDNKIICDLIDKKHKGIIALLDEECLRPGDASENTFLEKLDNALLTHEHYFSYATEKDNQKKKNLKKDEFTLRHYAGDVSYSVYGFLDKNNELLFRDLKAAMAKSKHSIIAKLYPDVEVNEKKRPETSAAQFKKSLNQLMTILMTKHPSYIRCIKPNDRQTSNFFDKELVRHQVKYLGLMENVRVRRAGFAYRRNYEYFLNRYKSLSPLTWPIYDGSPKEGVKNIVQHLKYAEDEYRMGKTKIFIRLPKTLFRTEDAFQQRKHELATFLQSRWKGRIQRRKYVALVEAVTVISKHWKRVQAYRQKENRKWASLIIRRFIRGFITRNESVTFENAMFQSMVKSKWLMRLSRNLPKSILDHKFPKSPKSCEKASELLMDIHKIYLVRKYVKQITAEMKFKFEEKILAESIFKDKKANYELSFPSWFEESRLSNEEISMLKIFFDDYPDEKITYSTPCTKYDRNGYKERQRILVVTLTSIYTLEAKDNKLKLKENYKHEKISQLTTSPNADGFLMIEIVPEDAKTDRGDLILSLSNVIEAVTKIVTVVPYELENFVKIVDSDTMYHKKRGGKQGIVILDSGLQESINKDKQGHLLVIGSQNQ